MYQIIVYGKLKREARKFSIRTNIMFTNYSNNGKIMKYLLNLYIIMTKEELLLHGTKDKRY